MIATALILVMVLGVICSAAGLMDAAVTAKVDVGASLSDRAGQSPDDRRSDRKAVLAALLDGKNRGPGSLVFGGLAAAALSVVATVILAMLGIS